MEITPLQLDLEGMGETDRVRAAGLHASTIYNDLFKDLEPERYGREGAPSPLLLATGLFFEQAWEEGIARDQIRRGAGQIERPDEQVTTGTWDGHPYTIYYNPDLLIFNGEFRVGEIKATWLSSKVKHEWLDNQASYQDELRESFMNPKFDKYWTQLKLYCKWLHTPYGRLYALFIAGDYSRPYRSQLIACDVTFSQDELDANEAMVMNHAVAKNFI